MTPQKRLVAALEKYWPEGCAMFTTINGEKAICMGWTIAPNVINRLDLNCVSIIAAVAACHWRVMMNAYSKQSEDDKYWNALCAHNEFYEIYEAAQAGEAKG